MEQKTVGRLFNWMLGLLGTGVSLLIFWGIAQIHEANAYDSEVDRKIADLKIPTGAKLIDAVASNSSELLSIREILLLDRLDEKRSRLWDLEDARDHGDDWTERDERRLRELEEEIRNLERELEGIGVEGVS